MSTSSIYGVYYMSSNLSSKRVVPEIFPAFDGPISGPLEQMRCACERVHAYKIYSRILR
jgi:hypothetical protein